MAKQVKKGSNTQKKKKGATTNEKGLSSLPVSENEKKFLERKDVVKVSDFDESSIFEFQNVGDTFQGYYHGHKEVTSKKKNETYQLHSFLRVGDNSPFKIWGGAVLNNQLLGDGKDKKGVPLYAEVFIKYIGQGGTGKRKYNNFVCYWCPTPESEKAGKKRK